MSEDRFLERLQRDAAMLRHTPDDVTLSRIRARIRARILRPTVAQLLAAWFRPLTATLTAIALAAVIGMTAFAASDEDGLTIGNDSIEISMAGATYSVSQ